MWSGEAPADPEQQQRAGVQAQKQQVKAEEEPVELQAQGKPLGLSRRLTVLLGEGQTKSDQLLEQPVQPGGWSLLDLSEGQQVHLQGGVRFVIWDKSKKSV